MTDGADRSPDLRFATAGELDRLEERLSEQMTKGFAAVTEDIRSTRHGLNETLQKMALEVGRQGWNMDAVLGREKDRDAREQHRDLDSQVYRRQLVTWTIAIAGIVSAAFWAGVNLIKTLWGKP